MPGEGKRPVVFLDRDGVLVEERGYTTALKELSIFPYSAECIRQMHEKGYYAIVVTNQSGIARGMFSEEALQKMNCYLMDATGVDAVYYCPHHPDGKIDFYKKVCECRKPEIGLFKKACQDFPINMEKSFMVGDRADDVLAGQRAGVRTVLLESGYGTTRLEKPVTADYILDDLRDVLNIL